MNERNIQEALEKVSIADFILVGIGSADPARSGFVRAGYLSAAEMDSIFEDSGAIGDIGACFFDSQGGHQDISFNNRIMGISLDDLENGKAEVVGVAGGHEKAGPILGALRGSFIDTLVTDDSAAREVIQMETKKEIPVNE